jgi:hypothetical protein
MRKGMSDVEIMRAFDAYFRDAQYARYTVDDGRGQYAPRASTGVPIGEGRELLKAAAEERRSRKRNYSELRNSFGFNGSLKKFFK